MTKIEIVFGEEGVGQFESNEPIRIKRATSIRADGRDWRIVTVEKRAPGDYVFRCEPELADAVVIELTREPLA